MTNSKNQLPRQLLLYILLFSIAVLLVAIYNDYSADLFNEFEYALAKSLGNLDGAVAGK